MVAIVGGNNFGLNLGSLSSLGLRGQLGSATQGRNGERAYVNAATGNLVLQDLDTRLVGLGPDTGTLRTYNSLGSYDFDGNADGWQTAPTKAIQDLGGGILRRIDVDGSTCDYVLTGSIYVAQTAAGSAVDTILKNGDGTYTWTDGASGTKETYQAGTFGRITKMTDTSGNTLAFGYTGDLLTSVVNADGETVTYAYGGPTGRNLAEVKTTLASGAVLSQVQYAYDELNRLKTVTVALNPTGTIQPANLVLNVYTTTYAYDGTSARVAGITQSDGTSLGFTYVLVNGQYRVASVTDGLGKVTSFGYDAAAGKTTITDPMGVSTVLLCDTVTGQLKQVKSGVTASNPSGLQTVNYDYDAAGDLRTMADGLGRTVTFTYVGGDLTKQVDAAGNTVERTYDARNQVLTETVYAGAASTQPLVTRYVYDAGGKNLLRFVVTAEGRVTEHRYDAKGQRTATIEYGAAAYDVSGLGATAVPTESQMTYWAGIQDNTRNLRTDFAYDFRGQLQTTTAWASVDANGGGVAGTSLVTKYVYDERGELIRTVTPDRRGATDTVYDGLGRVLITVARSADPADEAKVDPANPISITTVTQYDDANRATKVTLANGLVTTSTYDRAGRLATVVQSAATAPNLGTTSYYYDADGRLLMANDPTGRRTFLFWDAAGRKVGELDPTGALAEYLYDSSGQLTGTIGYATAVDSQILPQLVDSTGKPLANVTLGSSFTAEVWDPDYAYWYTGTATLRPSSSAGDAKTWRYYDAAGRLTTEVDALGYVTRTEYDGASRVLSVTRYATPVATGGLGSGTGTAPAPSTSGDDRVLTNVYDRDGLLRATIDGEGFLTQLFYDASGRLVKTTRYAGKVPGFTDASSIAVAVATARSTGVLTALVPTPQAGVDIETFTFHDAAGRKLAEIDGEKYLTEFTYDANGSLRKTIRYATKVDATTLAKMVDANGNPVRAPTTDLKVTVNERWYDPDADCWSDTRTYALRPAPTSADRVTENVWDALGRLWKQRNAEGTWTEYAYDSIGNVIRTTVALDTEDVRTLLKQYDVQGRITAELSPNGAALITSTSDIDAIWAQWAMKHTYDAAGRRTTTTDALGNRTVFFYDDDGRLRYTVNALGELAETAYDTLGRVTATRRREARFDPGVTAQLKGGLLSADTYGAQVIASAGGTLDKAFTYTARGDLNTVTDGAGGSVTYDLDAFGEVKAITQKLDATNNVTTTKFYDRRGLVKEQIADSGDATHVNANTSYEYDAFGRLVDWYDANRNRYDQKFDRLGRIVQTTDPVNPSRYTTYDAFDRVLTQVDAFGNVTKYAYDDAEPSATVTTPEGISVKTVRNRHGQTLTIIDGNTKVTSYGYDRNGNLLYERRALDATTTIETSRSYDRANNLLETKDGTGNRIAYVYDAANRVMTRTVDPDGLKLVTKYEYDGRGYQVLVTDPRGTVTELYLDAAGRVAYQFIDESGACVYTRYTYDLAGRGLTVKDRGVTTTYVYDALGRRTQETVDARTTTNTTGLNLSTKYAYDKNGNMVRKTDPNQNVTRYVYDALNRLVYTMDALGDVQKNEYDAEGRVTAKISYLTAIDPTVLSDTPTVADVAARIPISAATVAEYRVHDKDGRVTAIVDSAGGVTKLTYDGNGNVTEKRTYATPIALAGWTDRTKAPSPPSSEQDVVVRTIYDGANRAKYVIDGIGGVVEYTYDGSGNVVERRAYAAYLATSTALTAGDVATALSTIRDDAKDVRSRTVYDAAGRAKFTIDGEGGIVEYRYDADGMVVDRYAYANRIPKTTARTDADVTRELAVAGVKDPARDLHVRNVYDSVGRLVWTADGTGAVTGFVYDGGSNLVKRIAYARTIGADASPSSIGSSAADRVTIFVYDKANRLRFQVDALGGVTQTVYDAAGNVVKRIAHANRVSAPTGITDPAAVATTLSIWSTTGAGVSTSNRVTRFAYDKASRLQYEIDAAGAVTERTYDALGDLRAVRAYATVLTSAQLATIDAGGSVSGALTTSANDRLTVNVFDGARRVIYTVDALGYVMGTEYDGAGRVKSTTVYKDKATVAIGLTKVQVETATGAYDALTDARESFKYDAAGNLVESTDALGLVESYTYAGNHLKTEFTNKTRTATWKYAYDATGRLVAETSPAVKVSTASENASHGIDVTTSDLPIVTRLEYDALGNLVARTEAANIAGQARTTRYGYDAAGHQIRTTFPMVKVYVGESATLATNGATGAATRSETDFTPSTAVTYDAFGEAVANTDVSNHVSYKVYDALGHVQFEVDALGYVTEHGRNAFGEETSLVRYSGPIQPGATPAAPPTADAVKTALAAQSATEAAKNRTITTVRDLMGRATTVTEPPCYVEMRTSFSYNEIGAAVTKQEYNAFGENVRTLGLSNTQYSGALRKWVTLATRRYDARGQEVASVDALGSVTTRSYDAAGNLTFATEYAKPIAGTPGGTMTDLITSFDASLLPETSEDDRSVQYTYDLGNRRTSEIRLAVECTDPNETPENRYLWDDFGNGIPWLVTDAAVSRRNLTTTYEYDALGNLTRTTDALGGQAISIYDALGRVTAVVGPERTNPVDGSGLKPLTVFRHDAYGNLVEKIEYANGQGANIGTPAAEAPAVDRVTRTRFDERGNGVQIVDAEGIEHLRSYDEAGRLAKEWQLVDANPYWNGSANVVPYTTLFTAYEYDALGRQTAIVTPGSTSVLKDGVLTTVSNDEAGTVRTVHEYNAFGELERRYTVANDATSNAGDIEFFHYDNAGHLWRTNTGDGVVKVRIYDLLGRVAREWKSSGADDLLNGDRVQDVAGGRATVFVNDALGRVQETIQASVFVSNFYDDGTSKPIAGADARVYRMTYDRWGNVLSRSTATGSAATHYRYDANNQVTDRWEPTEGGVAYDPLNPDPGYGGAHTISRYDALGRLVAWTDPNGNRSRQVWDAAGEIVQELHADTGVVKYVYDAYGDRVRTIDAESHSTFYGYDRLGRNTTVTSDPVAVWSPNSDLTGTTKLGDRALTTTKIYDRAGRVIKQVVSDGSPTQFATQYTFDRRGQVVRSGGAGVDWTSSAYDVWGREVAEKDGNGALSRWTYDAFGVLTGRPGYAFVYDKAGRLTSQTQTYAGGVNRTFTYDQFGQLKTVFDAALNQTTEYGYNLDGKRTYEFTSQGGTTYQKQWIAYDALGRIQKIEADDKSLTIEFDYDRNGNRTLQTTVYAALGLSGTKKYYSAYDRMNRQILVDGAKNYNTGDNANLIDGQGHVVEYDRNGNRTSDKFYAKRVVRNWSTLAPTDTVVDGEVTAYSGWYSYNTSFAGILQEYYTYDALNRLKTSATGTLYGGVATNVPIVLDSRRYNAFSQIVQTGPSANLPSAYGSTDLRRRVTAYDSWGRVTKQRVAKPDGGFESLTEYLKTETHGEWVVDTWTDKWGVDHINRYWRSWTTTESTYDGAGNATGYRVTDASGALTEYAVALSRDGNGNYRENGVTATRSGSKVAETQSEYDVNGHLRKFTDLYKPEYTKSFIDDANGVILEKTQETNVLRQVVVNGNVVAIYGKGTDPVKPVTSTGAPNYVTQTSFDTTFQPITSNYPAAGSGQYPVQTGDTLRSIAQSAYGDADLWYVIADANALRSDGDLRVGQVLTIPTRPSGVHNRTGVFKPYDPSRIIGDTSPYIPAPKPKDDGCLIVKLILVAVVTIAVSVVTGGLATTFLGPMVSTIAAAVIGGAVGSAVGSMAGQGLAWAMNMQDGIDWKQVGISALSGAASVGVGLGANAVGLTEAVTSMGGVWGVMARTAVAGAEAAVANAATQGLSMAMNLEDDWSWRDVAAAAASASAGKLAGEGTDQLGMGKWDGGVVSGTITGTASGVMAQVVRGGKIVWEQVAADAFGNALGNAIGGKIAASAEDGIAELRLKNALNGVHLDPKAMPKEVFEAAKEDVKKGANPADVAGALVWDLLPRIEVPAAFEPLDGSFYARREPQPLDPGIAPQQVPEMNNVPAVPAPRASFDVRAAVRANTVGMGFDYDNGYEMNAAPRAGSYPAGYMDQFGNVHRTFCGSCHSGTPEAMLNLQLAKQDPRVQFFYGAERFVWGSLSAAGGVVATDTGLGAVFGVPLTGWGYSEAMAGWGQMFTSQYQPSPLEMGLQGLGMSPEWAADTNAAIGLGLGMGSAAASLRLRSPVDPLSSATRTTSRAGAARPGSFAALMEPAEAARYQSYWQSLTERAPVQAQLYLRNTPVSPSALADFPISKGSLSFADAAKLESHFVWHGAEFGAVSADEYLAMARGVTQDGIPVTYAYKGELRSGFVQFMGNGRSGASKFAFVGTNADGYITTFHVESGNSFWKMLNGSAANKTIVPAR